MSISFVRRTAALGVIVLAGALLAPPDASATAPGAVGGLDPSFSTNAPAGVTDVIATRQLVDVAVQQDGKIVAVSDQGGDFFIARYTSDGTRDTTFGVSGTGTASVDIGGAGSTSDRANAVAIDAQNRIVVVGAGGAAATDFALVRLDADGKSVQINTHVHVGNPPDSAIALDVAFQSDGTIVAVGNARVSGDRDFAVVRFDGTTGAVIGPPHTTSLASSDDSARGVAVYPTGPNKDKIVMVGTTGPVSNTAIAIVQVLADGTTDNTFNNSVGNKVIDPTTADDSAAGVAIKASGSIVVAGQSGGPDLDVVVTQLLPSGSFDGAFNLGSVRKISKVGNELVQNHPLALQPDGKILIAADSDASTNVGVFRLNADGSADSSFGTGGDATFDVDGNDDANAVAIDQLGRILVAGDDKDSAGFLARLIGIPDTDGDGLNDSVDACPTVPGTLPNGCPAPAPEAVLKGKKVLLDTVLAKKKPSAKCPTKATVSVKTKSKQGPVKVTRQLKTSTVTGGCRVHGKVNLHAKPKKTAKVKVTVTGKKLTAKHLIAVRL